MIPNWAWADNLRALAIFGVVIIHAAAPCLYQFDNVNNFDWQAANALDSAFRFCVPVFLMLTGALVLSKDYPLKDFLRKKFIRIILPFVFWSTIYIAYKIGTGDGQDSLRWIIKQFVSGSEFHLWYVYTLIGIYLFLPLIGKWIRNSSENEILLYLSLWLLTFALRMPAVAEFFPKVDLTYFTGYLGYVILGYYLSRKTWGNAATIAITCVVSGIAITFAGTWLMSMRAGQFSGIFYQYLTPNVVLLSGGIFVLVKYFSGEKTSPAVTFISRYSYGIYLVHVLVLDVLQKSGIDWQLLTPIAGILITAVLCLPITLGLVWLLSKLPYGKYISG